MAENQIDVLKRIADALEAIVKLMQKEMDRG